MEVHRPALAASAVGAAAADRGALVRL